MAEFNLWSQLKFFGTKQVKHQQFQYDEEMKELSVFIKTYEYRRFGLLKSDNVWHSNCIQGKWLE